MPVTYISEKLKAKKEKLKAKIAAKKEKIKNKISALRTGAPKSSNPKT